MSVYERFVAALKSQTPQFSAWIGMGEPQVAATLARSDFDAITFDMQHGAIDFAAVARALPLVLAAGKPAVVRIPVGEFACASRLLDAGASAIIAPMINSAAEARALVSFCKFPPVGSRSWGPGESRFFSDLDSQQYLGNANRLLPVFAMIETREALAALDDILAVDGLDGVFVGPGDLSIALSGGATLDPGAAEVEQALAHVVARCREVGKTPCVYAVSPERARAMSLAGFAFIAISGDGALLRAAADDAVRVARAGAAG